MAHRAAIRASIVLAALALAPATYAQTQDAGDFPNRPIRILVGFTPGSASDVTARLVGNQMSQLLKQPVIIVNRPGAGATIAAAEAARAPNDGYTLFLTSSAIAASMSFRPNLTFDMAKDFAAITPVNNVPLLMVVSPKLGVKNVKELIALAKAKPGEVTYGSPGVGTGTHLGAELFAVRTGIKIRQISYRGSPEAIGDVVAGRVSFIISPSSAVIGHIQADRLIPLAAAGAKRTFVMPDLPTMMESGVPDFDISTWFGLVAPAGTPKPVIDRLAKAINAALNSNEVQSAFKKQGFDTLGGSPEEFTAFIDRELKNWGNATEAAGVRIR